MEKGICIRMRIAIGYTGYEEKIRNEVLAKRETQLAAIQEAAEGDKNGYTAEDWQVRTEGSSAEILEQIRDMLLRYAKLNTDDRVLIYRADGGLLLWPSSRITLNGCTAGLFKKKDALQSALRYAETFELLNRPITALLPANAETSFQAAAENTATNGAPVQAAAGNTAQSAQNAAALFPDLVFDAVLAYNPAVTVQDFIAFFDCITQEHTAGARILLAFQLPQNGLRLSAMLPPDEAVDCFAAAEAAFFSGNRHERFAWDEHTVKTLAEKAGYTVQTFQKVDYRENRLVTQTELNRWFSAESEYGTAIRSAFASEKGALEKIIQQLEQRCRKPAVYTRTVVYMTASRQLIIES